MIYYSYGGTDMRSYIHLIRHGITEGNKQRWMYGASDIPLIEEGYEELSKQVEEEIYPRYEHAHYYTSGKLRCEQTLKAIYGDVDFDVFEPLVEIDCGDWECTSFQWLSQNVPGFDTWNTSPEMRETPMPNGESLNGFRERIHYGFEAFRNMHYIDVLKFRNRGKDAHSVAVIHGGVITAIMYELFGNGEESTFWTWIVKPGRGVTLILEDGKITGYERF